MTTSKHHLAQPSRRLWRQWFMAAMAATTLGLASSPAAGTVSLGRGRQRRSVEQRDDGECGDVRPRQQCGPRDDWPRCDRRHRPRLFHFHDRAKPDFDFAQHPARHADARLFVHRPPMGTQVTLQPTPPRRRDCSAGPTMMRATRNGLLDDMSVTANGSSGFSIPLGPGSYAVWLQEILRRAGRCRTGSISSWPRSRRRRRGQ